MKKESSKANSIQIQQIYPDICKHSSCLNKAKYEFIDDMETIGHSCETHVKEVNKLLTSIYREDDFEEEECFFI